MGHALDLEPSPGARRLSVGSRADPRIAAQPPARGGVRGLRRARRRCHAGAGGRARRPLAPGRPPRAAGRGGRRLRPGRRPGRDREQDRAPPPARLRRRRGAHGHRREPPVGAHQAGRAGRGRGGLGPRRGAGARTEERPRRGEPFHARPGGQPGDAGAGRPPRLRLAQHRRDPGQGDRGDGRARRRRRRDGPRRGARRPADGGRQPRPPPRRGRGGRAPVRQREVPPPVRDRGAPGGRARRGPARPLVRGARRAVGRGEGGAGSGVGRGGEVGPAGQNGSEEVR